MRAWVVPVEGDVREVEIETDFEATDLGALIGVPWIEFVKTRDPEVRMVVDEEGHLRNRPLNRRMSLVYRGPLGIAGDVLLVGWDSEATYRDESEIVEIRLRTEEDVNAWLAETGAF